MESVAEVPEEASGLCQPRFWIRVFLLLDRLPAKANEPCLRLELDALTYFKLQIQTTKCVAKLNVYIARPSNSIAANN